MKHQKEHIDSLLRKITVISFFLIVLLILNNDNKNNLNSVDNKIESVLKVDLEAIQVSSVSFHFFNTILAAGDLSKSIAYSNDRLVINWYNSFTNIALRLSKKSFEEIKPKIDISNHSIVKPSIDCEGKPLFS